MGLNLTELREMVWVPLGMDTNNDVELPTTKIDLYLNRSLWEIMDKFDFREKEKVAKFDTIVGTSRYNMPEPFEALLGLYVGDEFGENTELIQVDMDRFQELYSSDEDDRGFPTHYQRIECYAEIHPIPDDIYTITIKRLITVEDLSVTNATPQIPQVWHEVIGYGALWRAFLDLGDFTRSVHTKHIQNSLSNTIETVKLKEKKANTSYASLQPMRPKYNL